MKFKCIRLNSTSLLMAGVMALGLTACSEQEPEEVASIRPVRSVLVNGDAAASLRTFSGVSRSVQESRLSFKVSGTIDSTPVKVGDAIEAGTIIASIDPSSYELQLQQAQATVEQSKAAARNASSAYQRTRSLYASNNASLGDLDATRANADSAEAQLRAANKSLQLAELNLSYTELMVDVDCTVDSLSVAMNENVAPGSEVARVNCSDELEIELAVPSGIIGNFKNGRSAEVEFDAIPNRLFSAQITEVGVAANGVGSTFPVTVLVQDKDPLLRTGLAASVSFRSIATDTNSFVLPLSSLVKGTDGAFVYVVSPQDNEIGTIEKRSITYGDLQSGGIEVLSGLSKNDRVVTAGVSFVRAGLIVRYAQ